MEVEPEMPNGERKSATLEGYHYKTGEWTELSCLDGRIIDIQTDCTRRMDTKESGFCFLAPGLVDLQINGYAGFDMNTVPIEENTVLELARALWREGVTTFFPTVITNDDESIEAAVRSIASACKLDEDVSRAVGGIHLEGPFLSPEDGARGAHPKAHVKAPSWNLFQRWQDAAEGRIKLITVSPEWANSTGFISACTESGVTVSIGHTSATPEQIREAVGAGARMSTHLGNGAHLMLARHPNYIWEQLAQDDLWTCVIADGFHLPESFLKVVLKVKDEQVMLVSDAVKLSGMEPGEYSLHIGGSVVLTPQGRLHLADNPKLLAGSAQMLAWGIAHLERSGLCSLGQAWDMASLRPSRFMGLEACDGLVVGAPADVAVFEKDHSGGILIKQTYKNGRLVFQKEEQVGC
jgi:N-acetylglucosamine-6-phosphate deacetylase